MRNLILAASITLFAFSGTFAKNITANNLNANKNKIEKKQNAQDEKTKKELECFIKVKDAQGNTVLMKISCDDIVIRKKLGLESSTTSIN